jgi:TP901 family phage tail tape measure protein
MALEKIGLGAIVTVDTRQAQNSLRQAGKEMETFRRTSERIPPPLARIGASITRLSAQVKAFGASMRRGGQLIGTGFRNIAMSAAPLTLAMGTAIRQAVKFEKQMSAVGAVTLATAADMQVLSKEARRQGIVSVFSATQAAEAQEQLGRAGANTRQIMQSLAGVIDTASSDEIDLATATDIVTTVVKGMGAGFEKATHVADVLALTSASAKTNVTMLGESFIYGTSAARMLNLSVEETAAIFGKMADAGLRGSLAGTGLTNMLAKITKPTEKAKKIMDKWGIVLEDDSGKLNKVSNIVGQFNYRMGRLKSVTEKNMVLQEIFGRRGARAMSALMTAGKEGIDKLEKMLLESSRMFIKLNVDAEKTEQSLKRLGITAEGASYGAAVFTTAFSTADKEVNELDKTLIAGVDAARKFGFEVEETTVILNELARANITGSKAGAGLINVIKKISEPTDRARKIMDKWGIVIHDHTGKLNDMSNIVGQFRYRLGRLSSVTKKAKIMQELFGESGSRVMSVLMRTGKENLDKLQKEVLDTSTSFEKIGAAAEMARRRLDNVWGASILLKSSLESLSISLLKTMMGPFKEAFQGVTDSLNSVLFIMQELEENTGKNILKTEGYKKAVKLLGVEGAQTAVSVAKGFKDAAKTIKEAWDFVVGKFKEASAWLEDTFGRDGVRKITKFATLFIFVGGLLTPVILGLGLIKLAIGGILSIAAGLGTILAAAFWPAIIAGGLIYILFGDIIKENESLGETVEKVWNSIKTWVLDVYENGLKPFIDGIKESLIPIANELGEVWKRIAADIKYVMVEIFSSMSDGTNQASQEWKDFGVGIGYVIGGIAKFISALVESIVYIVTAFVEGFQLVWRFVKDIITDISEWFASLGLVIEDIFAGNLTTNAMRRFSSTIFDLVLKPIRLIIEGVILLAETWGAGWIIPKSLRDFAEKGVTGLTVEEKERKTYRTRAEMFADIRGKKKLLPEEFEEEEFGLYGEPPTIAEGEETRKVLGRTAEEQQDVSEEISNLTAAMKGAQEKIPEVNIKNEIENKHDITLDNKLCVDGESLNIASGRHKKEIQERSGFKSTPWQRRALLEHGAAPITRSAS